MFTQQDYEDYRGLTTLLKTGSCKEGLNFSGGGGWPGLKLHSTAKYEKTVCQVSYMRTLWMPVAMCEYK